MEETITMVDHTGEPVASIGSVIWAELAKAQAKMEQPVLDSVGHTGKNGSRAYKYASLASVRKSVFPPCNDLGIFITQHFDGDNVLITEAYLGGERAVLDRRKVKLTGNPQDDGSAETYAKRYALCSVFGLAGVEDDDGESASKEQPRRPAPGQPLTGRCRSCGSTYTFQSEEQMRMAQCCPSPNYEVV
jgi:hypothetical protein